MWQTLCYYTFWRVLEGFGGWKSFSWGRYFKVPKMSKVDLIERCHKEKVSQAWKIKSVYVNALSSWNFVTCWHKQQPTFFVVKHIVWPNCIKQPLSILAWQAPYSNFSWINISNNTVSTSCSLSQPRSLCTIWGALWNFFIGLSYYLRFKDLWE